MLTIEKLIAEETAKAKEYKAQANSGWSFFPRKRLSYLECERSKYYAERHNQIAVLLRELQERRKEPKRVKGRWIEMLSYKDHTYKCSECGRLLVNVADGRNNVSKHYPYCHCGADMRGEQNEVRTP